MSVERILNTVSYFLLIPLAFAGVGLVTIISPLDHQILRGFVGWMTIGGYLYSFVSPAVFIIAIILYSFRKISNIWNGPHSLLLGFYIIGASILINTSSSYYTNTYFQVALYVLGILLGALLYYQNSLKNPLIVIFISATILIVPVLDIKYISIFGPMLITPYFICQLSRNNKKHNKKGSD